MKNKYLLKSGLVAFAMFVAGGLQAQTTYTFTNCGATGQNGPGTAAVDAEYLGTTLEGDVTQVGGIQYWTVPATGNYSIEAFGAQGGDDGGLGARIYGEFLLTAGEELQILVGQAGATLDGLHGSGGGGSFVVKTVGVDPILIAGGGGGHGKGSPGINPESAGSDLEPGQSPPGGGPGGVDGGGGAAASGGSGGTATTPGADAGGSTWASGGGGFLTEGGGANSGSTPGGQAYVDGGTGGDAASGANSPGGFGGGGGAGDRGAGGGGWCGGGAGTNNNDGGAGGGSLNTGTNQDNEAGNNSGHGTVIITQLCSPSTITVSADTICYGDELTLTATSAIGGTITWDNGAPNGTAFTPDTTGLVTYTTSSDTIDCEQTADVLIQEAPEFTLDATDELAGGDGTASITLTGGTFPFTYDWDNDGTGDFDDDANQTGLTAGWYTVTVMSGNGCTWTDSVQVSSQLSIEEFGNNISLFPNPTTDNITLSGMNAFTYAIVDAQGKVVMTGEGGEEENISLTALESGIYVIKVEFEGVAHQARLIKQ